MSLDGFLAIAGSAWTTEMTVSSLLAGLLFGFVVFGIPLDSLALTTTPERLRRYIRQTVVTSLLLGWVFFTPAIVGAWWSGDALWPRIVVRFVYWGVFAAGLWIGMSFRVRVDAFVSSRRIGRSADTPSEEPPR